MVSRIELGLFLVLLVSSPAVAQIIDHASVDAVADLPQSTMDIIGSQRWYFMHASVGGNMLSGMDALAAADPDRYLLDTSSVGDYDPPPDDPELGTVYDANRGNPGWQVKVSMFEDSVQDIGWRDPDVNIVMNKMCYIDQTADAQVYLASMIGLENEFPTTTFVYMTMPLIESGSSTNVLRGQYNDAVREYCSNNGRVLFDIADIEAHDPDGNPVTFTYDGEVWQRMYSGYTSDGGHLNTLGQQRVALGWYATAAAIASTVSSVDGLPELRSSIEYISPNPFNPATTVRFYIAEVGEVDVSVFDARGHLVSRLFDGMLQPGHHDLIWRGVDEAGNSVGSGVYFARLEASGQVSSRRMALVR